MADVGCTEGKVQVLGHLKVLSDPEKQTSNMASIQLNYYKNVSSLGSFCVIAEKHLSKLKRRLKVVLQVDFKVN